MINIRTTKPSDGNPISTMNGNIQITDIHGNKVPNVMSLNIHTQRDDAIRADVEVFVGKLDVWAEDNTVYVDQDGNKYRRQHEITMLEEGQCYLVKIDSPLSIEQRKNIMDELDCLKGDKNIRFIVVDHKTDISRLKSLYELSNE